MFKHLDFFKCTDPAWTDFLFSEDTVTILNQIQIEEPFYPASEDVFACFYKTSLTRLKVVVLGQDPYHNGAATGLCFDVKSGHPLNPSLKNIYTELKNEGFQPKEDGCLEHWANQGVLLLNTALTVRKGEPESHLEEWSSFHEHVMKKLATMDFLVWVVLGKKAADYKDMIPRHHLIREATHPSPYSASKNNSSQTAFLGSGIFRAVNEALHEKGLEKIAW